MRRRLQVGLVGVVASVGLAVPLTAHLAAMGPPEHRSSGVHIAPPAPATKYAHAVDAAHARGLRVWIESDLVKRWREGVASFHDAVSAIAALAGRPGVIGVKIADELGYHDGLDTPEKVQAFLDQSAAALHAAAPGKQILVDAIVPELGCLPGYSPPLRWATICAADVRGQYPQLALAAMDGYLQSNDIDVIDLSTGLLPERTYEGWGVTAQTAQRAAWAEVHQRGWDQLVQLQGRKAVAHPGNYTDSAAATRTELATFVDIPLALGANAVDIWTWRQLYQGQIYRLMDPGLRDNALWQDLLALHGTGAHLFTHLSPNSVEVGLSQDLDAIAQAFTDVFIAAGTG